MTDRSAHPEARPEGETPEEPTTEELGKLGSPGAGRDVAHPHPADADPAHDHAHAVEEHPVAAHGSAHPAGHDDATGEHEHPEPLGPIDRRAWGASALGLLIALLIVVVLALPTLGG